MVKLLAFLLAGTAFAADTRFEISYPASSNPGPITGRVYVMISRMNDHEPRLQVGRVGIPFFGRDVEKLGAGQSAIIDASDLGLDLPELVNLADFLVVLDP